MDRTAVYRRLLRRETHSPRTVAAVVVALLAAAALLALCALGAALAWDAGFREAFADWLSGAVAGDAASAALTAGGSIAVLVALVLLIVAITPGRRARHARTTERSALVVDDGVLADAAADAVAGSCALDRRQVSTTISRRSLTVRVTPTSGIALDRDRARGAALAAVTGAGFDTTAEVELAPRGVIS